MNGIENADKKALVSEKTDSISVLPNDYDAILAADIERKFKHQKDLCIDPDTGLPWGLKNVLFTEITIRSFHPFAMRIQYTRYHTKYMGRVYAVESKEQCLEAIKALLDEVLPDWLPEPPRDPENPRRYL
ncbi:hypothetical protein [Desulforegula conservatrix]|uniref:hypothetical protein n=1 Tax=Desulforegula conservatrix TaxID=153026 RepID=UPI00041FF41A|nr:hypothetical protein [Desulforegula conservatrix]